MKTAFSLVELSIVLVILGLLTGGILAGQNLIRAAELRSVTTDFDRYVAATHTFRDQYMALPGDMKNATTFWGAFGDAAAGSCPGTAGTGTETCNGDGNGQVGTSIDSDTANHESAQFWKQLANAGMIEGTYTGVMEGAVLKGITLGVNAPHAKISNTGFSIRYMPSQSAANTNWFEGNYGNVMHYGGATTGFSMTTTPVLMPEEAWNIDTKLDDGIPGRGKVVTRESQTDCNTTADYTTAQYNLTNTTQACNLNFRGL